MRALALDFDGVISDSAAEAFVVGLATYQSLCRVEAWAALADGARQMTRVALLSEPLYEAFLERMPLGNRAEDFGVVLRAIEQGVALDDQAAYDRIYGAVGAEFRHAYHARFYDVRAAFRSESPEQWCSLMGPYAPFLETLRAHVGEAAFAIATAKDRDSVDLLLEAYGVTDLFPPDLILDKETGPDKRVHVRALADRIGLDPSEITFVDDKVNHLESVSKLGARCALAGWGYNGERERKLARARGFAVLDLDDAAPQLFGAA